MMSVETAEMKGGVGGGGFPSVALVVARAERVSFNTEVRFFLKENPPKYKILAQQALYNI